MCSRVPAWAQSPGAHLSFHTSLRMMCWRCFHVRKSVSSCPWRPAWLQILMMWRNHWLSLHTCSHSPDDLVSRDWPDLDQRLRAAGPRVSAPHRTQCSIQTALPLLPTPQSCPPCDLSSNFPRSHSSHPSKVRVNCGWCSVYMRLAYLWKLHWTPSG